MVYHTIQTIEVGSTTADLIPFTGVFTLSIQATSGTSGQVINIFRSDYNDGSLWTGNSPDSTCTLNASNYCTFTTNHLSLFALTLDITAPTFTGVTLNSGVVISG